MLEVEIHPLDLEQFQAVLSQQRFDDLLEGRARAARVFEGRTIWNLNSTASGGGVAEMLESLLAYASGAGVTARWLVIRGNDDFFRVTKRMHNRLHGEEGDPGELGDEEREVYEHTLGQQTGELLERLSPDDVVLLHDPQTVGLAPAVAELGATVVWRCHIGVDRPNDVVRSTWEFLRPYLSRADGWVFSRKQYVWDGLDDDTTAIIPPSIDAFSPKNQEMGHDDVKAILAAAGVVPDGPSSASFLRRDRTEGTVERHAEMVETRPIPPDGRIVVQVSRWDRLKDPVGVLNGFAEHVSPVTDAHLVLAGPATSSVTDDPEGVEVLEACRTAWEQLPDEQRDRIHLASLPTEDAEENAAIVNALQRRASVVVQKSLAEGFGLTVAEAMWKERPVVAPRLGGIQDQIVHGDSGLLIDDPRDLGGFGDAVVTLLGDEETAARMGRRAKERVREEFLGPRHLLQYLELIERLLGSPID